MASMAEQRYHKIKQKVTTIKIRLKKLNKTNQRKIQTRRITKDIPRITLSISE